MKNKEHGIDEDAEKLKEDLRQRCALKGCEKVGKDECFYCGHNYRENAIRVRRGLVEGKNGLFHYVPSKREVSENG